MQQRLVIPAFLCTAFTLTACDSPDPVALAKEAEAKLNALYPETGHAEAAVDIDMFSEQLAAMLKPVQSLDFDEWQARGGGEYGAEHDVDTLRRGSLPRAGTEAAIALLDKTTTDEWLRPLDELRAAPRFTREWTVDATGHTIDPLGGRVRAMVRILLADARLHHHREQWNDAAEQIEHALALGHAMQRDPILLHRLTGTSLQGLALTEMRFQLVEGGHDEATCARLLAAVDEICVAAPLRPALEVEAVLIAPTYAGLGYSNADIRALRGVLEESADRLVSLQSRPYVEQDENADFVGLALASVTSTKRLQRAELIDFQRSALSFIPLAEARWRNDVDATTLLLRIHLYRHRKGHFPESLDDFVPQHLPSIPLDSITGAPFQYRLENGEPLLYSLGRDGKDDNGEHRGPNDLLGGDLIGGPDIRFTSPRPAEEDDPI